MKNGHLKCYFWQPWRQLKSQILTLCRTSVWQSLPNQPVLHTASLPTAQRALEYYRTTVQLKLWRYDLRESWFNIVPHIFWEGQSLWWPFLRRSFWFHCVENLVWHLFLLQHSIILSLNDNELNRKLWRFEFQLCHSNCTEPPREARPLRLPEFLYI